MSAVSKMSPRLGTTPGDSDGYWLSYLNPTLSHYLQVRAEENVGNLSGAREQYESAREWRSSFRWTPGHRYHPLRITCTATSAYPSWYFESE